MLTLYRYLECGGRYDETAEALLIHRSTLRYRLQRIRDISQLPIGEADVNFNLQLGVPGLEHSEGPKIARLAVRAVATRSTRGRSPEVLRTIATVARSIGRRRLQRT